jgi:hypothetical protein
MESKDRDFLLDPTEARWLSGAEARWLSGAEARWLSGAEAMPHKSKGPSTSLRPQK